MLHKFLADIPYTPLLLAAVLIGLAPFVPEPHLMEKLRMLAAGQLTRPIDIFDLAMHASPAFLLAVKFLVSRSRRNG